MLDTVSGATKVASIILQDKAENTSVKYDNKKGITTTTTKILPFDMWLYLNHYSSLQNKTKEEIQTIKEKFPEYVRQYKDSKGLIPLK